MFRHRRPAAFVLIPAVLVGVTTFGSLWYLLLWKYWPPHPLTGQRNYLLSATAVVFILLAVGFLVLALRSLKARRGPAAC
jgi:hypothetical protein